MRQHQLKAFAVVLTSRLNIALTGSVGDQSGGTNLNWGGDLGAIAPSLFRPMSLRGWRLPYRCA